MKLKNLMAAGAAAAMLLGTSAAQASSANSLSLARAATSADESNDLFGAGFPYGVVIFPVVVGVVYGLVEIVKDDNGRSPASP